MDPLSDFDPENLDGWFQTTDTPRAKLRKVLAAYSRTLAACPGTSWSEIYTAGEILLVWKQAQGIDRIFDTPRRFMTATLDDGIGQGLKMIHRFGELAGLELIPLGLMQSPEKIIAQCNLQQPDFLGLTILHFATEEVLCEFIPQLPDTTRVIVGGPIFNAMTKAELNAKPYTVIEGVGHFLSYVLDQ